MTEELGSHSFSPEFMSSPVEHSTFRSFCVCSSFKPFHACCPLSETRPQASHVAGAPYFRTSAACTHVRRSCICGHMPLPGGFGEMGTPPVSVPHRLASHSQVPWQPFGFSSPAAKKTFLAGNILKLPAFTAPNSVNAKSAPHLPR